MKKDFHFHAIYKLAKQAGFSENESYRLGFCSQFVDDCNNLEVEKKRIEDLSSEGLITSFKPILTQYEISLIPPDITTQRYVIMPFHFIPKNLYDRFVSKNSLSAINLVNKALGEKNIYSLGIALHTYADTWSHQGFSAFEDDENQVMNWATSYRYLIPNIGHADIGDDCDIVEKVWFDYRRPKTKRKVINKKRFKEALYFCYFAICKAYQGEKIEEKDFCLKSFDQWNSVESFWDKWLSLEDEEDRISLIDGPVYNKDDENFHRKSYELFQVAAKNHIAIVLKNTII